MKNCNSTCLNGRPLQRDLEAALGPLPVIVEDLGLIDGNGRAARLLMNLALLQEGYPVTIIPPVLRSDYLTTVRQGNNGNEEPFVTLLSNMVWESQRDYLRLLQNLERK